MLTSHWLPKYPIKTHKISATYLHPVLTRLSFPQVGGSWCSGSENTSSHAGKSKQHLCTFFVRLCVKTVEVSSSAFLQQHRMCTIMPIHSKHSTQFKPALSFCNIKWKPLSNGLFSLIKRFNITWRNANLPQLLMPEFQTEDILCWEVSRSNQYTQTGAKTSPAAERQINML